MNAFHLNHGIYPKHSEPPTAVQWNSVEPDSAPAESVYSPSIHSQSLHTQKDSPSPMNFQSLSPQDIRVLEQANQLLNPVFETQNHWSHHLQKIMTRFGQLFQKADEDSVQPDPSHGVGQDQIRGESSLNRIYSHFHQWRNLYAQHPHLSPYLSEQLNEKLNHLLEADPTYGMMLVNRLRDHDQLY